MDAQTNVVICCVELPKGAEGACEEKGVEGRGVDFKHIRSLSQTVSIVQKRETDPKKPIVAGTVQGRRVYTRIMTDKRSEYLPSPFRRQK